MNEIITGLTTKEKLNILADAAKYDVACTSSGVDRGRDRREPWATVYHVVYVTALQRMEDVYRCLRSL